MFIDCRKAYSHRTGISEIEELEREKQLWSLQWCHFYAPFLPAVYEKYRERGGRPVFHPESPSKFWELFTELYFLASSSDYIRDMRMNEKLSMLLTMLMEESWHPEDSTVSKKRMELTKLKEYLDEHYTEKISLDDLAAQFFINKYYLTKIFKETYGTTIGKVKVLTKKVTMQRQVRCFSKTYVFPSYLNSPHPSNTTKQRKETKSVLEEVCGYTAFSEPTSCKCKSEERAKVDGV